MEQFSFRNGKPIKLNVFVGNNGQIGGRAGSTEIDRVSSRGPGRDLLSNQFNYVSQTPVLLFTRSINPLPTN